MKKAGTVCRASAGVAAVAAVVGGRLGGGRPGPGGGLVQRVEGSSPASTAPSAGRRLGGGGVADDAGSGLSVDFHHGADC